MKIILCSIAILLASILNCNSQTSLVAKKGTDKKWWKEAVVYQIYPRSFKDSDGDGIGDLRGIISKLDYIKSLGVNTIWLNPIYSSPNDDNGYDVSDYRNIMKDFGTMADFDLLLKGLHERGIKLVMDFVLNHSSDEHEWFKQSKSSRTSPYRNYYHWWDAERVKPNYRYSLFDVNHDAWKYDSVTNAYYLHYFSKKQPDLNWENPKVRKEIYDIMKFWADKGIDGYRLDAFQFASKDTSFPAFPTGFENNFVPYYAMGPHLHDYLKEMNQEVFSKYDVMTVAEGAGNNYHDAHDLVDADRNELNMAYAFDAIDLAKMEGYDFIKFKETFSKWDSVFANKGWLSIFLASHDQARIVNRFGNASPEFRELSSKMLSTFLLTMRGTPFIYNGDELGMTNAGFEKITDYRDMSTLNEYQYQLNHGGDINQFMKRIQFECRDNGRTPFQWDDSTNAGFSTGTPWIQVNTNFKYINRAEQEMNQQSVLNYFRKATDLRQKNPSLIYGKYTLLDKSNPDVYAYLREFEGKKFLVLLNFSSHQAKPNLKMNFTRSKVVLANYPNPSSNGALAPYESIVYQLN